MGQPFMADEDEEELIIERRDRERLESGKVENDETIPLIPNVKTDARKTIHAIQVWKMDPPNDGLKGSVPPFTNHESIAKLFGNGIYDFYAVTIEGKVLRRHTGIKVNIPLPPPSLETPLSNHPSPDSHQRLLEWQSQQHAKETARIESFGKMAVDHTRDFSSQQLSAIRADAERQAERDRTFYSQQAAQTNQFFASMLSQAQQIHQHSMERQREDSKQFIHLLQMSHERAAQASDPRNILGLLREGMLLARGDDPEDDSPENAENVPVWASALREGAAAVKDITETYKIKAFAEANGGQNPLKAISQGIQKPPALPKTIPPPPRKLPFTSNQVREMARLKTICAQRGLDFDVMLRNASQYFASGGPIDESEQQTAGVASPDESVEPSQTDSVEGGETDVDGNES